ncbi:MAG: GHMP family kinase ATP-binding protein [Candidatus Roseilinea sp.]|uniref:GHMP family kinase ATP-binding protein n=1 Tax=Candidatus Roseilinea sp. TaxID=2838777 RepID=UPI00404B760E
MSGAPLPHKPIGAGCAFGHHGELLQGVFRADEADSSRRARGLITLPCRLFWCRARFTPDERNGRGGGWGALPCVRAVPPDKVKARRAAEYALQSLSAPLGGQLHIVSNIPSGRGLGSSTADVTAAIRAVFDCYGAPACESQVARLAVAAETASDAMMFWRGPASPAVLFAQREGRVIETFGGPLPPLIALGFDAAPDTPGIDTLGLPLPAYTPPEQDEFEALRRQVRHAISTGDSALIGQAATRSAMINQRYLPTPGFEQWMEVGAAHGAVGVQVAHSGTVVGLLFDPRAGDTPQQLAKARARLAELGVQRVWQWRVS